jgi:RNA polymerase sigma factor (TIGR02999 family)
MSDVTRLEEPAGDRRSAAELLPLVYDELRKLAAAKLAAESPGHTLDATALVHDAWLKLNGQSFSSRSSYLKAAAVAMRRLLVDHARAKKAAKRGSGGRVELSSDPAAPADRDEELDALDAALERLAVSQPRIVELVQLRYFVGLTIAEAAAVLDIAPRTADAWWAYARGWLAEEMRK